jgi:hypothetical protein
MGYAHVAMGTYGCLYGFMWVPMGVRMGLCGYLWVPSSSYRYL